MNRVLHCLLLFLLSSGLCAGDDWRAALGRMPLGSNVTRLDRTNCVDIMLRAFQSNQVVKAFIFMPGATDELYFFRRAKAELTNASPSLLDAVDALTNRTFIRAVFRPPLLLLHTEEDALDGIAAVEHEPTAEKLRQARGSQHLSLNDRDWDAVLVALKNNLGVTLHPRKRSPDSWHFYRQSFAAWNLTAWETLETIALAGKTKFTVKRRLVEFEADDRYGPVPKLDQFPH
jgi:hypothetical protein